MQEHCVFVDAHHHLWNLSAVSYPWLQAKNKTRFFGDPAPIQRDYEVADFQQDWGSLDIEASVHIQVGTAQGSATKETRWLDGQAEAHGLPTAIVAYADLRCSDLHSVLDGHCGGSSRLRGIRQIVSRHPSEDTAEEGTGLLQDLAFIDGLELLAARGLSFDLQLTPPLLHAAAELFAELPELRVALCHAGSPWDQSPAGLVGWREGLEALAACPNVFAKLSGLGMFDRNWTGASLAPIVDGVLETFGPGRTMWGSNFPVDKLYHRYEDMFDTLMELVPPADCEEVFGSTAAEFYRLGASTQPG